MRTLYLGVLAILVVALGTPTASANDCCFDRSRLTGNFLQCKTVPGFAPTGNPNCWSCAGLQIFFPDYLCSNVLNNCNANPGPIFCTLRGGPGDPSCQWDQVANHAVGCNSPSGALIEPAAIPTLSEWGMIVMVALLLIAGVWMLRRRTTLPQPA